MENNNFLETLKAIKQRIVDADLRINDIEDHDFRDTGLRDDEINTLKAKLIKPIKKHQEELEEERVRLMANELQKCKEDPYYFARNYITVNDMPFTTYYSRYAFNQVFDKYVSKQHNVE